MKRLSLICTAIAILSQVLSASPKSDSIVAFTGSRTKIIWMRYPWCNADYSPKSKTAVESAGATAMLFDTDEGQERILGTGLHTLDQGTNQGLVRVSRSGHWATVCDLTCTYIFDLTGTNPNKRVFLDKSNCTFWAVRAWGRDAATGVEYAYALDNFTIWSGTNFVFTGTAMYRIPVRADGTADVAAAVKIPVNGSPKIDGQFSVSADMKKIGGLYPWDGNPAILDAATGTMLQRKNGSSCQTNIAADNSYRFFHLNDDHNGIYMWDKDLGTTNWYVSLEQNMVHNYTGEFWSPRWCNDLRFVASTVPASLGDDWEQGAYWGWSAATVKSKPFATTQSCVLQKFTADFKKIEKSMAVISDNRNFEYCPDVWMAGGYTGGAVVGTDPKVRASRPPTMEIVPSGSSIRISHMPVNATVRLMDARGRVVDQRSGADAASVDIRDLDPGAYVASIISSAGSESKRVTIAR